MKTTFNGLMTVVAICAASVTSSNALACGGHKGSGHSGIGMGYHAGGFGVRIGASYGSDNYNRTAHYASNSGYRSGGYSTGAYPYNQPVGRACEPFHCAYVCQAGDSFYTVSLKEYGSSAVANQIAWFNQLQPNAALVPGQRLVLPSVSATGQLTRSLAPAPSEVGIASSSVPDSTENSSQPQNTAASEPAASKTAAPSEPALPKVAVGSTLMLEGQQFGDGPGVARLRVSGLALPIEVLEWNNDSPKIRLPDVQLPGAIEAQIEVLRADGSLASKTVIELTPAAETLALGN